MRLVITAEVCLEAKRRNTTTLRCSHFTISNCSNRWCITLWCRQGEIPVAKAVITQIRSYSEIWLTSTVRENKVIRPLYDNTYCVRSAFTHLGFWWKLYYCSCITSELEMCHQTCSIDIFVDLQSFGCNFNWAPFEPRFGVKRDTG